jgi:hypothetical protein
MVTLATLASEGSSLISKDIPISLGILLLFPVLAVMIAGQPAEMYAFVLRDMYLEKRKRIDFY